MVESARTRRKWPIVLGAIAVVALVLVAKHFLALAPIGAGYAAEQTCACLFISGRSPESCRDDLDPLARVLVTVRAGDSAVTASAFGVATATARYQKDFGCTLRD